MWRWSYFLSNSIPIKLIFSTYVEVILVLPLPSRILIDFLHVCGGDPTLTVDNLNYKLFSPRMWRWSYIFFCACRPCFIFSTYVEVILFFCFCIISLNYFLHVCGGDPELDLPPISNCLFSPRMWRWSSQILAQAQAKIIFSTYVEVILNLRVKAIKPSTFSPRMWRWSYFRDVLQAVV